jgi:hypothetical protein
MATIFQKYVPFDDQSRWLGHHGDLFSEIEKLVA